ncbi:Zn-finger protein [Rhizoctonia solani]|uniref:Zn-finger protein n=1 Tax=Rhizoctonia solani TaxID=456999 RepID=A0A8H7M031_9AGAM|nr:Zn-finger protein [Rhizoctonia solani]
MTTVPTDEGKDLHIKSTLYCGRVPWDKVEDLLHHVDQLPHGANWRIIEIKVHVKGEDVPRVAHLCARDVVEIVVELMGNPWFASYMKFAPERHWTAEKDGERIYNKMWTGDWWWNIQQQLLNKAFGDATVAALIVSSNKTQVSILPGGQQVYPVYVSLGNICKSLRRKASERSTVLLGYLPVEDFDDIEDDNERQRLKGQLVHDAMRKLMKPLEAASRDGVEMWCADGRLCRVFLIVASYVADWPEQCLMAEKCPRRKPPDTLDALEEYFDNGDVRHLNQGPGLKPWWPWWANIPYCDIHASMTPNILHHGVSGIGQWTGRKAREMAKQMLCAVAGSVDNEEAELARIGIEFMSYAELPTMRESDVAEMEQLLTEFHDLKWIMVNEEFGTSVRHTRRVQQRGTQKPTYPLREKALASIEQSQTQKADDVKDADAGKGADVELEQREYAKGDLEQEGGVQTIEDPASVLPCRQPRPSQVWYPNPRMTIAKNPTHDKVPCRTVINEYGAKDFIELLTKLLADQFDTPAYKSLLLENHQYAVWHRLYLKHPAPLRYCWDCIGLGTYDVVLVLDKPGAGGIHRIVPLR